MGERTSGMGADGRRAVIEPYLTDTCIIVTQTRDEFGRITETDSTPIKCRRESINALVTTDGGEEILATDKIIMKQQALDNDQKIKLDGRKFKILKVSRPKAWYYNIIEVYL